MHSFDLDKLEDEAGNFEAYFRTPELAAQAPLAWLVERKKPLLDPLRSLFSDPQHVVQEHHTLMVAQVGSQRHQILQREASNESARIAVGNARERYIDVLRTTVRRYR